MSALKTLATTQRMRWLVRIRLILIFGIDASCVLAAYVLTFALRFDSAIPQAHVAAFVMGLGLWPAAKLTTFAMLGLHRRSWRYTSTNDMALLIGANVAASGLTFVVAAFMGLAIPRSIWLMDLPLCFLATASARMGARVVGELTRVHNGPKNSERTIVYGAGDAGTALVREIRRSNELPYRILGFVDDSPNLRGVKINGVPVLGQGCELSEIATGYAVDLVLIAVPSATGQQMSRILKHCQEAGLAFKTTPRLTEMIQDRGLARQIRDVAVEDLLGRSPVQLEEDRIAAKVRGRTILVTGAAGSIGSELCRQIARFRPAAIVAFDFAESPLFQLEQEMARCHPDVQLYPTIGSVQNNHHLNQVFARHLPSVVYHAAAYKHVPMMEAHAFEAVENNLLGTVNVALAAERFGVEDFVMISSDKAVRPTNIMGATKRAAELAIRSLQNGSVKYISVRFGNVLGSSGSVIPVFKEQIARGGPVTVTDPEMRRYFMTIPEACQLVLQAGAMGEGGEIFVLDMGDPVKIVDLARDLIALSGLQPDTDIKITFTGIRPGEKLYEELNTFDEETVPTDHYKIKMFMGTTIPWPAMQEHLRHIQVACESRNLDEVILTLKAVAPEYNPSCDVLRQALRLKPRTAAAVAR